jgi:pimeloyl-ACP methyl ester carboxylesterase
VTVNGVEITFAEAGAGGRPLLLVHGFGGAKEDFTDYLPRLAAIGWHAVAPDNRGHGDSEHLKNEDAYSLSIVAGDIGALMDELGWPTATVLGHSMGGMVVQLFALARPERLDALILMDTSHRIPDHVDPEMIAAGQAVVRDGGTELLVEIGDRATEPGPLDTLPYLEMIAADPAYKAWARQKTLNFAGPAWAALAGDMATQEDRLDALRSVAVRTLVIVGELDDGFVAQSKAMADAIPNAQLAVIPAAGHSPQFEARDEWWSVMQGFLAEVAG